MVQNDSGTVAYINSQTDGNNNPPGSLVLAGYFFEGKNPDPQAQKIQFVLYGDFERIWLDPVSCHSTSAYGHQLPRMADNDRAPGLDHRGQVHAYLEQQVSQEPRFSGTTDGITIAQPNSDLAG